MHNLFLAYIVNLYMFRAYLSTSSGGTTIFTQLVIISTKCCTHMVVPPDDGPRYARNMQRLTIYTENKLCIKLVFIYTIISRCKSIKHKKRYCPLLKRTALTLRKWAGYCQIRKHRIYDCICHCTLVTVNARHSVYSTLNLLKTKRRNALFKDPVRTAL